MLCHSAVFCDAVLNDSFEDQNLIFGKIQGSTKKENKELQ